MFALFVDSDFMDNLFILYIHEDEIFADFRRFMRQVKGLTIFTNLDCNEDLKSSLSENPFWFEITENIAEIIYDEPEWKNLNSWETLKKYPFTFFMTDSPQAFDNITHAGYEYITSGSIKEQWKPFSKVIPTTLNVSNGKMPSEYHFSSFGKLCYAARSFYSLIILDNFLFNDSTNQSYTENLNDLLDSMLRNNQSNYLDLIFFFDAEKGLLPKNRKWDKNTKLKKLHSELNRWTSEYRKRIQKLEINLICLIKGIGGTDEIHDRRIYTNNFLITSGAGFNLFQRYKGNNKAIKNTEISIKFIFWPETMYRVLEDIEELNSYCRKLDFKDYSGQVNYYPAKRRLESII